MLDSLEMPCSTSIPAAGRSSSAPNWLDRLRSNKGFPAADNLHLDHFLTSNMPSASPTRNASNSLINSKSASVQSANTAANAGISSNHNELVGLITNVLSDLFNMGSGGVEPKERGKRCARKQANPRFCVVSSPADGASLAFVRKDQNLIASSAAVAAATASSSLNFCDKNSNNGNDGDDDDGAEEIEGREMWKGYSRSEVTVIDTSCQGWKFDKLVFRRKNVWKVRDKKGKSFAIGTKKRKTTHLDSANATGNAKKKAKISNLEDATRGKKAQVEKEEELNKDTR